MSDEAELLSKAYSDPSLKDARPCPFCGNTTLAITSGPQPRLAHRDTFQVFCPCCVCRGPLAESRQRAITKWNGHWRPLLRPILKRKA